MVGFVEGASDDALGGDDGEAREFSAQVFDGGVAFALDVGFGAGALGGDFVPRLRRLFLAEAVGDFAGLGNHPLPFLARLFDLALGFLLGLRRFRAGALGRLQAFADAPGALVQHPQQRAVEQRREYPQQDDEADELRYQPRDVDADGFHSFTCFRRSPVFVRRRSRNGRDGIYRARREPEPRRRARGVRRT